MTSTCHSILSRLVVNVKKGKRIHPYVNLYDSFLHIFSYPPFSLAPTPACHHIHVTGTQLLGSFPPETNDTGPPALERGSAATQLRLFSVGSRAKKQIDESRGPSCLFAVNQMIRIPRELPLDRAGPGPVTRITNKH